jgi:hypothetical protein
VDVYQNGVLLKGGGADYTATTTTSVVLTTGATADDVIEIIVYDVFAVANLIKKDGDTVEGVINFNGKEITLDEDFDTSITADTDDEIHIKIAGADDFKFKANTLEVQTGSNIDMNGTELILDADADTSITADTDDRVDIKVGGTDTVHIDSSGIGVNINNPLYPLHVTEASGGDTAAIFIDGPTDGTSALYMGDSDDIDIGAIQYDHSSNFMSFRANASERMRINSSGAVMIGTTSSPNNAPLLIHCGTDDNLRFNQETHATISAVNDAANAFVTLKLEGDDILLNSQSGNPVLIGTSTAQGNMSLQIEGDGSGSTAQGSIFLRRGLSTSSIGGNTGADLGLIQFGDNDGGIYAAIEAKSDASAANNDYPGRLMFSTTDGGASSPTERARITRGGTFLVGSTSGTISQSAFGFRVDQDGFTAISKNAAAGTSVTEFFGASGRFQTMGDGDAENSSGRFSAISDERYKENIVDANSQWDDIKAIKVRNYNFKEEKGWGTHKQIGVVAQELEASGMTGGLVKTKEDGYKSVATSVLYMKAVKALQEAMTRIETLEAEVKTLKGG